MRAATLIFIALAASATHPPSRLPWKEAGLTEREAAAHLLNRFAYGPRPGQVDAVVKMGLDRWFERQLAADLPDPSVREELRDFPALAMSSIEIARVYPSPGQVLRQARKAGVISDDGLNKMDAADLKPDQDDSGNAARPADSERRERRRAVLRWAEGQGIHPQRELIGQLMAQKLYRAVQSENQLAEVMTDFWFNHFNVSMTDNQARPWLLSYERDAIRPNALGKVRGLLEATARHPAMLLYLDNAQSTAAAEAETTMGGRMDGRRGGRGLKSPPAKRARGVNENYARELMELHTLGVDGGYTQADVVQVARAFTGWTMIPPDRREEVERRLARARRAGGPGSASFATDGDFLFRADMHDAGAKTVLGKRLPAGRGVEDGEDVLDLLAVHPATARHLATKLAVRFVSDQPPPALVDRLTTVYLQTGGDVRALLRAIAQSPEFWSRRAVGAKVKSPFELAASALRATGARVESPRAALQWIARMGQPLYAYQAPTGYPDRAEAWVSTGALLNRMNFGLQLASGRVDGVGLDLPALLPAAERGREPASREEALRLYAGLLLPGRTLDPVLQQLNPMVSDPGLAKKIDEAAPRRDEAADGAMMNDVGMDSGMEQSRKGRRRNQLDESAPPRDLHPPTAVEQIVGVILGSPEFQRR
jgi:uncharacterized protein (DUF1800 family)